jgi:preprotein translocase subunit SecG
MILTLHVVVCVLLIILVLLQSGKEGMGVIFGGGSSSLFGSTGAGGILVKLTTFVAVIFLCTSLGYNIVTSTGGDSGSRVIQTESNESTPGE